MFSDRYHTTVGVRVDKATLEIKSTRIDLMLWDIAGEDEFEALRPAFLRGTSAYILVADGTRPKTLETALQLHQKVRSLEGAKPFLLLLNKKDLASSWRISPSELTWLSEQGWPTIMTSAKTGDEVENAFLKLAQMVLNEPSTPPDCP